MSEVEKGDNVAPENVDNVTSQDSENAATVNDGGKTVQYDTYKRVLGKLKNTEVQFAELNEQVQTLQREKLEAEGNKDQLIDSLKKEVMEHKTKLKTTVGAVARSNAMSAIADEAVKAGCNSPDVVKKFLEDQIGSVEFDSDFKPDREQIRALVDDAKKSAPVLFGKQAPATANHNLSSSAGTDPKKKLKNMSMDDLINTLGDTL